MDILQTQKAVYDYLVKHELFDKGWRFKLTRAHLILGTCNYTNKFIGISRYHIQYGTDEEILDTIRHEIAHALVGPGYGHGLIFQAMTRKLGTTSASKKKVTQSSPRQWEMICSCCGFTIARRHRRMSIRKLRRKFHVACGLKSEGKLFFRRAVPTKEHLINSGRPQ